MKRKKFEWTGRLILIIFSLILVLSLIFFITKQTHKNTTEQLLTEYMNYINKHEYEKMYKMISKEHSSNISMEEFVKRNKNIYEGLETKDLSIKILNEKSNGKEISYLTSFNTLAGEVKFQNEVNFIKEKFEYKLVWKDSIIFPQLESTDKVRIDTVEAERGQILDRNGKVLAGKGVASSVGLVPGKIQDKENTIIKLAELLEVDIDVIKNKLSAEWVKDDSFVPIKTIPKVSELELMKINPDENLVKLKENQEELLSIPGVMINDIEVRDYPLKEAASHLVGYIQKVTAEDLEENKGKGYDSNNYLLADTLHRANDFRPLLRNYQALIIDEAHKFPEAARQMYGKSFGPEDFMEICSLLEGEHYTHIAAKLREAFSQLFESLPRPQGVLEEQARFRFVLNRESRQALRNSIRWLQRAEDLLIGNLSRWTKNRLEESREVLLQFLNVDRNNILFLEYTSKGLPVFCTVHRKTESLIKADIWERGFPAILTSGTLKAGESFQRSEQLNGLEDVGRVREYQADSPFDYDENCLLYMPRRKRKVYDSYHGEIRFLSEQIRKLVCSTFGHTLVLFTSYSMMGNVYRELRGNLPFPLLKVWKDSQSVIREFKAQKNCVLFAAGSCWEGVDFPGDVVSSLIIVRLPFAVPDPVREAERERYQTLKEYIQKIIVPDMQIKLRQGFGRAIRTETDTCVVSILDSRAGRGGKYHKEVIDALPVCRITDRMADVENFIRNRKRIEYYM